MYLRKKRTKILIINGLTQYIPDYLIKNPKMLLTFILPCK